MFSAFGLDSFTARMAFIKTLRSGSQTSKLPGVQGKNRAACCWRL